MLDLISKVGFWLIDRLIQKEAEKQQARAALRAFVKQWQEGDGVSKVRSSFKAMREEFKRERNPAG